MLVKAFQADELMSEILSMTVASRHGIMNRIKNSDIFKEIFHVEVMNMPDNVVESSKTKIFNTSTAGHRFDTQISGLTLSCLLLDALIGTALKVASKRAAEPEGSQATKKCWPI